MTHFFTRFLKGLLHALLIALIPVLIVAYVQLRYQHRIFSDVSDISEHEYAVVLGARVLENGQASDALSDRVLSAVTLYTEGKVQKLLMSGDGVSDENYNEPAVMRDLAISRGVSPHDIVIDTEGVRTFSSCERLNTQYALSDAVLVTQAYHLPRTLFLCNSFGVDSEGYEADLGGYIHIAQFRLREIPASLAAFFEVNFGQIFE